MIYLTDFHIFYGPPTPNKMSPSPVNEEDYNYKYEQAFLRNQALMKRHGSISEYYLWDADHIGTFESCIEWWRNWYSDISRENEANDSDYADTDLSDYSSEYEDEEVEEEEPPYDPYFYRNMYYYT